MKKFYIRALNKAGLLKNVSVSSKKEMNGQTFNIPVINKVGFLNLFPHEAWMPEVLKYLFKIKKGAFIDVGANTGQTLLAVKSIDKNIPYIGFEPNPACVLYLRELIRQNDLKDVTLYPCGIAERSSMLTLNFFSEDSTDPMASIVENFRPDQKTFRQEFVPCFRFDQIEGLSDKDVAVIKIDVEGGESEVLKGMRTLIEKKRPLILIEILPVYKAENTERLQRQAEIETMMAELNYSIARIWKHSPLDFHFMRKGIGIHEDINFCDYVLLPQEMEESFYCDSQKSFAKKKEEMDGTE
ncbi:MAG: FkbM family methyltransferase [Chitinophagaceae bacterium]